MFGSYTIIIIMSVIAIIGALMDVSNSRFRV